MLARHQQPEGNWAQFARFATKSSTIHAVQCGPLKRQVALLFSEASPTRASIVSHYAIYPYLAGFAANSSTILADQRSSKAAPVRLCIP